MVKGPWDDLPKAKPPREPILKRRARFREPIINNWKILAILLLMVFVMPTVVRWLFFTVVGLFQAGVREP
jgi:hypothetical protein